jgi:hypothetical protein
MPKKQETESAEVANVEATLETLATAETWEDAIALLQNTGVEVYSADAVESELGDGFTYVEKRSLVNVPFIIMRTSTGWSEAYNTPRVTVHAMTNGNQRIKFVDFSTGVLEQLETLKAHGREPRGMIVPKGLTESIYDACETCKRAVTHCECSTPQKTKATTYFLGW